MFVSKTGAYPKGVPVLLANTRLGIIKIFSQNSVFPFFFLCFSFAKNTFILLFLSAVTDTVICGDRPKKLFFSSLMAGRDKLERLYLASLTFEGKARTLST
jgi:hypothetical protein